MKALMDISKFDSPAAEYLPSTYEAPQIDSKDCKSCSTIAGMEKMFLRDWANDLGQEGISAEKYMIHTANCGTIAHEMVACNVSNKPFEPLELYGPYIPTAEIVFDKFLKWKHDYRLTVLLTEHLMIDRELGYGGKIDLFVTDNVEYRMAVDLKPHLTASTSHKIQLSGYWNLLRVNGYNPVGPQYILGCTREPQDVYKFIPVFGIEGVFEDFKAYLGVLNRREAESEENKQPARKAERKVITAWKKTRIAGVAQ